MNIWSFCCLHPAHWEITHNKRISSRQQGTVSSQSTETISVYFSSSLRLRVVILSLQDNSALKWRKWLKSSQNPDFDLKHLCPHTVLSQQCVFVREKKRDNPSARPGTDNMLSAHRRTGMRMRREAWHFTAWHFLNVTYCSQRILPPLTFSFLISVSVRCSWRCGCCQTCSLCNKEVHSNRRVTWLWFIYLRFPGEMVLTGEGHLTLWGEGVGGDRLEFACWVWPHITTNLIYHSSFFCFCLLLFVFFVVSASLSVISSFIHCFSTSHFSFVQRQ